MCVCVCLLRSLVLTRSIHEPSAVWPASIRLSATLSPAPSLPLLLPVSSPSLPSLSLLHRCPAVRKLADEVCSTSLWCWFNGAFLSEVPLNLRLFLRPRQGVECGTHPYRILLLRGAVASSRLFLRSCLTVCSRTACQGSGGGRHPASGIGLAHKDPKGTEQLKRVLWHRRGCARLMLVEGRKHAGEAWYDGYHVLAAAVVRVFCLFVCLPWPRLR